MKNIGKSSFPWTLARAWLSREDRSHSTKLRYYSWYHPASIEVRQLASDVLRILTVRALKVKGNCIIYTENVKR
jgi:hypothetical protein